MGQSLKLGRKGKGPDVDMFVKQIGRIVQGTSGCVSRRILVPTVTSDCHPSYAQLFVRFEHINCSSARRGC